MINLKGALYLVLLWILGCLLVLALHADQLLLSLHVVLVIRAVQEILRDRPHHALHAFQLVRPLHVVQRILVVQPHHVHLALLSDRRGRQIQEILVSLVGRPLRAGLGSLGYQQIHQLLVLHELLLLHVVQGIQLIQVVRRDLSVQPLHVVLVNQGIQLVL